jgi:hypothetical protein
MHLLLQDYLLLIHQLLSELQLCGKWNQIRSRFSNLEGNIVLVDDTGIEPVTPSMSRKYATAALIVR